MDRVKLKSKHVNILVFTIVQFQLSSTVQISFFLFFIVEIQRYGHNFT